jgi:hypothetical protein
MAQSALPDSGSEFGERVRRRLREEQVIWITTVSKDGTPQPNPVGFLFQDDHSILIYNMVNANRIRHVADRPQVAPCTSTATAPAASWSSPAPRAVRMTSPRHTRTRPSWPSTVTACCG